MKYINTDFVLILIAVTVLVTAFFVVDPGINYNETHQHKCVIIFENIKNLEENR